MFGPAPELSRYDDSCLFMCCSSRPDVQEMPRPSHLVGVPGLGILHIK